jgi:hypothetical protein
VTPSAGPVAVATAPDAVAGAMIAAALESAGIPAEVRGGRSGWLHPGAQGGLGSVRIYVPSALADEARQIVADLERGA